jgi:protein-S-isoprenylcysteine O-methyltransferase Ste14
MNQIRGTTVKRTFWVVAGAAAQLLFAYTVYQLFAFLYAGTGDLLGIEPIPGALVANSERASRPLSYRLAVDLLLLVQFGLAHSALLYPAVRQRIELVMPDKLYGSFYATVASATVLLTATFWQPLPGIAYETRGVLAWALFAGFLTSWVGLFYSLSLTGLGFQTGLTPWWAYVRQREVPRRAFVTTGAYQFLRHPIYLSFVGLMWCAPSMTTDHLLMASGWTVYVYIGSVLKDHRLLFFLGDRYRVYMMRVPGYPLIPWGPLARRRV